jgi:hypothetical protein
MTGSVEKELLSKFDVLHLPGPTNRVEAIRERFIAITPRSAWNGPSSSRPRTGRPKPSP